jgi:hypothetical protein
LVPLIVTDSACSNTANVPFAVGACGMPVLTGPVTTVLPLCQTLMLSGLPSLTWT